MFEKEIAVIGPTEVIKPFQVLGINGHEVQDPGKAVQLLREIERAEKIGIVFIAEGIAEQIMEEIERIKLKELPAIFLLPEYGRKERLGLQRLEKTMARAIGKKL